MPDPSRPEPARLVIAGAGGWGLEALWVARAMNAAGTAQWDILGFADDRSGAAGGEHYGTPVLCSIPAITDMCGRDTLVFLAVGDNRVRRDLAASLERQGVRFATLIHPRAELAEDVAVGEGSYVGPFATLAPECKVGRHVMVNIHAIVGHEVAVGDFSQLAPGAVVTGACTLGEGVFVGANASLHPGRRLGDYSVVAGNSFVVADLEPRQTAMGIPARPVFQKR
jgi:sugar O-acyltransferase (sialic acid O-acetyltransferase NeuD family)